LPFTSISFAKDWNVPVTTNEEDDRAELEQARYNECRSVKTRTRRGEPVDVVNYMSQNIRSATRAPEDPVGGTIRDLKEHYEDCESSPVKTHPKAPTALPKFPPGDPRNKKPAACKVCEGTETIFDYGGPFSCGACAEKPEAA
jgi:hypothetical protein